MMSSTRTNRKAVGWALAGGAVLVAGIVAIVVASLSSRPTPTPAPTPSQSAEQPSETPGSVDPGSFVDPRVADQGWVPEPITTDAEVYIRAALAAASTFDTTAADRSDWLEYLDTWFTPDTRYTEADQQAVLESSQLELRQGVVLPESEWDLLAASDGRVVAEMTGEIVYVPIPNDPSGDMSIGTADVTLTFTQDDGTGAETSFEDVVRVSVQVLCGPGSAPTPGSAQTAGDCKVVRYFTEPLEP